MQRQRGDQQGRCSDDDHSGRQSDKDPTMGTWWNVPEGQGGLRDEGVDEWVV